MPFLQEQLSCSRLNSDGLLHYIMAPHYNPQLLFSMFVFTTHNLLHRLLDNKGAGTSVRDDAIASLRNCTTHANHASAIAVFKRGAAWLDKCKSSSESLNTRDTCSKLQYVIPPCNAERTALVLIKVLAVLLLVTVTGSVGVFSGALSQGVTPGVV